MTIQSISILMRNLLSDFGNQLFLIMSVIIGISVSYLLYKFFYKIVPKMIEGQTFTRWAWLDRHTYKPYKGYNRFRSREWNINNTL